MSYHDLREWLEGLEAHGELKHISGASWDLEMSGIAEIVFREGKDPKPAIMFDDIPGYPKGFRTLFGYNAGSPWRVAYTLGLPEDKLDRWTMVQNARKKAKAPTRPIPPKLVSSGPVLANSLTGDKIDVLKFPVPRFHEMDGGRYIGTAHVVIAKDPDSDWVNVAIYRVMVVNGSRLTLHCLEGAHAMSIMKEKYFARGQVMPIACAIGVDPYLYRASGRGAFGASEYNLAGGIKGEPIEVVKGPATGLPLPANAEIVIEGECHPGELAPEGPFGESMGYYVSVGLGTVMEPVIRVKAIHFRDNPILTCALTAAPPQDTENMGIVSAASMWNQLEAGGIEGIKGVWSHGVGGFFNVVSIQQQYPGHSRKVGLIASQISGRSGRYTVVVDEDIDPSNLEEVIWAIETRVQPHQSIQILESCASGQTDPVISVEERERMKDKNAPKQFYSSRAIIDTCRPFESKKDWYPAAKLSPQWREKILSKWQSKLAGLL